MQKVKAACRPCDEEAARDLLRVGEEGCARGPWQRRRQPGPCGREEGRPAEGEGAVDVREHGCDCGRERSSRRAAGFEDAMAEIFPNVKVALHRQIQEAQ